MIFKDIYKYIYYINVFKKFKFILRENLITQYQYDGLQGFAKKSN